MTHPIINNSVSSKLSRSEEELDEKISQLLYNLSQKARNIGNPILENQTTNRSPTPLSDLSNSEITICNKNDKVNFVNSSSLSANHDYSLGETSSSELAESQESSTSIQQTRWLQPILYASAESSYSLSLQQKGSQVAQTILLDSAQALSDVLKKRKRLGEDTRGARQPEKRHCTTRSEKEKTGGGELSEVLNNIINAADAAQKVAESSCDPEPIQKQGERLRNYIDSDPIKAISSNTERDVPIKIQDPNEEKRILTELALANPIAGPQIISKVLKEKNIKMTPERVGHIWRHCGLGSKEQRIEALRAYKNANPGCILTAIQQEALGRLANRDKQEEIIKELALANPFASLSKITTILEEKHMKIPRSTINNILNFYGLSTKIQRIEALRAYKNANPGCILTAIQQEALGRLANRDKQEEIIKELTLANPLASLSEITTILEEKHMKIPRTTIHSILKFYGLSTKLQRIEALKIYKDNNPNCILTYIQKEALAVLEKL